MTTQEAVLRQMMPWDPFDREFIADPYPTYHGIRDAGRVQRARSGMWVAAGYREVAMALRSSRFGHMDPPTLGRSRPVATTPDGDPMVSFQLMNPPDHTRLRGAISARFTPRAIERLRGRIAEIVDDLLDEAADDETVDFIGAFAFPLPLIVICELIGVPEEDRGLFYGHANKLARGLDPEVILSEEEIARKDEAQIDFFNYFLELAERRRREPHDDVVSDLVAAEQAGALTSADIAMTGILLLIAGYETTMNLMGNGTQALLNHPEQMAYLRDHPEQIHGAVEELLRYDAPVQFTARIALDDFELGGEQIREGEPAILMLGAANRDPEMFDDPDRLDLRRDAHRHVAFGFGIHACVGLPLALLEGEVAFAALALRGIELAGEPRYKENLILRGLAELPVRLAPA
jgi:cytochrome P450